MDHLRELVASILIQEAEDVDEDARVVVPLVAVDVLIARYSRPKGRMRLGRRYADLSHLTRPSKAGERVTNAQYDPESMTMLIGLREAPFANVTESILHEIQHFNQHASWLTDPRFRVEFVGDFDLPKGINAGNLDQLRFQDLMAFWRRRYGYNEAPHELDAIVFAQENLEAALDAMIAEFEHLDDDPGDPWGEKTDPDPIR